MKFPRMLAVALAGVTSIVLAGPADAQPLDRGTFHDEFTEVVEDFCDVPGLTVQFDGVVDGRFLFNRRGPDGLAYYMESIRFSSTVTNLESGRTVTGVERTLSKDLKVTDNGDGTLTILVLATGNATLYGEDGKAIEGTLSGLGSAVDLAALGGVPGIASAAKQMGAHAACNVVRRPPGDAPGDCLPDPHSHIVAR